ncbi:MAG: M20/M25/M40 family metallo-hydrolase [Gemmatimonadetes bacterium]|nr:M20/M25/M40 family metallo-hydrolase [Gemmatimonadota bacterium]
MPTLRAIIAAAALAPAALSAQQPAPPRAADPVTPAHGTAAITAADVQARMAFLASDALLGRNTPSPGLESAARYGAAEFARFGLRPAGDSGTFIQRYPYAQAIIDRAAVTFRAGPAALVYGQDYFVVPGNADSVGGKAVYVGTARPDLVMPASVSGRLVVVAAPDTLGSPESMQRWQRNLVAALTAGMAAHAAGVIAVLDPAFRGAAMPMLAAMTAQESAPIPLFAVLHAAFAPALEAAGLDLGRLRAAEPATPVELPLDFLLRTATGRIATRVPNVVAVLPGSDPVLRDEYVVFSAHVDHVGVGRPDASGDSIFNGADDDASGTVAVLELAQAFAAAPKAPARSLVFLLVSGEEKGLLGSQYYAEHPTVPAAGIVANLNADMIGHSRPDTVFMIGEEYTDLGTRAQQLVRQHAAELKLVIAPDLWPNESLFTRSDHYSFAAKGVPAVVFSTGLHSIYLTPADNPETIDNDKLARITRLLYLLGDEVANAPARPKWTEAGRARLKLQ